MGTARDVLRIAAGELGSAERPAGSNCTKYGQWYGYLRRDGLPTQPSTKGSTFKGPFHMPRSMILVDKMIGEILGR